MEKSKADIAIEYKRSCNCCQAVLLAFKEEAGLTEKEALALGSTFGAGMGGMEGNCGALVGAEMILGLTSYEGRPLTAASREIFTGFVNMCGSAKCSDLKGIYNGIVLSTCDTCVRNAVEILQSVAGDKLSLRQQLKEDLSDKLSSRQKLKADVSDKPSEAYKAAAKADDSVKKSGIDKITAYVDGSYNVATGEYSYGAVIFSGDEKLSFSDKFDDPELAAMRNVAGELEGAMKAMRFAVSAGAKELDIYYDYEGIEKWCTGAWKTNKDGTKAYKAFYESLSGKLKVNFHKVKGHSGDTYNDEADKLAKAALGI